MPQPVDEWVVDRQDSLLTSRRGRRNPTGLGQQRVIGRAKDDVDGRRRDAQIIAKASDRRSRAPFGQGRHQRRTVASGPDR